MADPWSLKQYKAIKKADVIPINDKQHAAYKTFFRYQSFIDKDGHYIRRPEMHKSEAEFRNILFRNATILGLFQLRAIRTEELESEASQPICDEESGTCVQNRKNITKKKSKKHTKKTGKKAVKKVVKRSRKNQKGKKITTTRNSIGAGGSCIGSGQWGPYPSCG